MLDVSPPPIQSYFWGTYLPIVLLGEAGAIIIMSALLKEFLPYLSWKKVLWISFISTLFPFLFGLLFWWSSGLIP